MGMESESKTTPPSDINNNAFANPFSPFLEPNDSDLNVINSNEYIIPFDINNNDDQKDEIWTNWTGPIQDEYEQNKQRKRAKSSVFADPFHWDTDDENNGFNDEQIQKTSQAVHDEIDMSKPFNSPFQGSKNSPFESEEN